MKAAIVGYGIIGRVHAAVIRALGATVSAVCDIDGQKLKEAAAEYPEAKLFSDYRALLEKGGFDIVHICTPHYLHAEMTICALERDFNVLCEKPLCTHSNDIKKILNAERRSKGQLGVCLQNRYNAAVAYAREYLRGKRVEAVCGSVFWKRTADYYAQAAWRGKKRTEGGGVLINQALHTLDLTALFAGMPQTVTAAVRNLTHGRTIGVEDCAVAFFGGEVPIDFYATTSAGADFPVSVTVKTRDETVVVLPSSVWIDGKTRDFPDDSAVYGKFCYGTGHQKLITDFYDCLQTGRKFAIDGREGAKSVRLIFGIYRSRGRNVEIK